MTFSAALFDMDGLLVDSERTIMNTWIDVSNAHGVTLTTADYLQIVGRSFAEGQVILARLIGNPDTFDAVRTRVREQLAAPEPHPKFPLKPGAFALLDTLAQAGIPRRKPPVNPACRNAGTPDGSPPQITSPVRGSIYTMRLTQPDKQRIAFSATTDADAHALYWFVNDAYVGQSAPGAALYWQPRTAGSYDVRAIDDHGRVDERSLQVSLIE